MIGALVAGITGAGGASLSSYESIATITASGSQSFVEFTSIPSTFKHLQIRGMNRDGTGVGVEMRFNGDTGANYARHRLYGDGSTVGAGGNASTNQLVISGGSNTANTMAVSIVDILDYVSTTKNKTVRVLEGADFNGSGFIYIQSGLWMNTSAITTIRLFNSSAINYANTTTFALYGIKEA